MTQQDLGQAVLEMRAEGRDDYILYDQNTSRQIELLARVCDELRRQDHLWDQQDHPLRLGRQPAQLREVFGNSVETYRSGAAAWKRANDRRVQYGLMAWDSILLEEVYEALSETDSDRAVEELIQVAAVALNAAMSIERNGIGGKPSE